MSVVCWVVEKANKEINFNNGYQFYGERIQRMIMVKMNNSCFVWCPIVVITIGIIITPFVGVTSQGLASKRCDVLNVSVAVCTEKFLISAQLSGLPFSLRMLNLDRNQISVLENNVFWVRKWQRTELGRLSLSIKVISSL